MIAKDELIEYARYVDNYYGTPRAYVEERSGSRQGCDPGDRDPGASRLKGESLRRCVLLVTPPTAKRTEAPPGRPWHGDDGCDRVPMNRAKGRSRRHG